MRLTARTIGLLTGIAVVFLSAILVVVRGYVTPKAMNTGSYHTLPADTSDEDPLLCLTEDGKVTAGFHTNLPIVLLTIDGEVPDYKAFHNGEEEALPVDPYTTGSIAVYDAGEGDNALSAMLTEIDRAQGTIIEEEHLKKTPMRMKKRGHTSYSFDKPQYLVKTDDGNGTDVDVNYLSMGEGHEWILNGSMADKSLLRNYLAYRIASEIDGNNMAPDAEYCEVLKSETDGSISYLGVYLLMETVSRGKERIDIASYKEGENYTSYIVRRDRWTSFDVMLETYGRTSGIDEQWIGVKYPGRERLNGTLQTYIADDFSRTEAVVYSEDTDTFDIYDKYIDVDSFADYFLLNEYFGNYDAGEHSTYMYKNSGDTLCIGPVWDFDQAMNNYFAEEMDTEVLSFQTRPFYKKLIRDKRFVKTLKRRYHVLLNHELSENHVNSVIDETVAYLSSAKEREWYRYRASYVENDPDVHDYDLDSYMVRGIRISRFNANYDAEIYNIKTYLHKHSKVIETELTGMERDTRYNTGFAVHNAVFFFIVLCLFFVPSIIINRKA